MAYGLLWYAQFTATLEKVILEISSYHDFAKEPEAFFHGLLLGFVASLQESHVITSNRESGLGRYDIMLMPRDSTQRGIVIELKAEEAGDATSLATAATLALQQIDQKHYLAAAQHTR